MNKLVCVCVLLHSICITLAIDRSQVLKYLQEDQVFDKKELRRQLFKEERGNDYDAQDSSEDGDLTAYKTYTESESPRIYEEENKEDIMEISDPDSVVKIKIGKNLRVTEGASITIRCAASGSPPPTITWELNRQPVKDNLIIQTADSLVIIKFQKHHSGYYTCLAENEHGSTSAYSNIHEQAAPPRVLSSDENHMEGRALPPNTTQSAHMTVGDRLSSVRGVRVIIRCPFIGFPYPRVTWFHNDVLVDQTTNGNIDITEPDGASVLTILSLRSEDAGRYGCTVFNIYGRAGASALVRIIYPGQPTIFSKRKELEFDSSEEVININIGTNITVFDGTTITIFCDVRGDIETNPGPENSNSTSTNTEAMIPISWRSSVTARQDFMPDPGLTSEVLLRIIDISPGDAGVYTCVANGGPATGDLMSSKIAVIRKIPPYIEVSNRTVRYVKGWDTALLMIGETLLVRAGLDVQITCPYEAFPEGKLSWQRNGVTLSLPEGNMESKGNVLTIKHLHETKSDEYTCVVKSSVDTATATSVVKVIPKRSKPPKIMKSRLRTRSVLNPDEMVSVDVGTNLHIVEGASVTVNCPAYGIPDPEINWFVDNEPVEDKYIITAGHSLVFLKFHQHHSGYYKCQAKNDVGQTRAFTDIRVEVPTELKIIYSSGSFQITEADHAVALTIGEHVKTTGGRNLTIYCPVEGTPKPKILWKYNDQMIGKSDRHMNGRAKINPEDKSIFVPNVRPWDSGVYSCYASNGFAVVSASSSLHILPEGSPIIIANPREKKAVGTEALVDIEVGTNITTLAGKSIRILCPAIGPGGTNGSKLFYDWTIDDRPLHYDTRMSLQIPNQLIIRDLQFFDVGSYNCRVYNDMGSDMMASYLDLVDDGTVIGRMTSKTDPMTGRELERVTVGTDIKTTKGKAFEIMCPTRGGKRPALTWLKDNVPIVPSNYVVPRGEVLLLQYVNPDMNGFYTCQLETEFGTKSVTTEVTVSDLIPGKIFQAKGDFEAFDPNSHVKAAIGQDVSAVNGVAITVRCPYQASPPGTITWLLNSTTIYDETSPDEDSETAQNYFFGGKDNALIIPKMSAEYIGRYTCSLKQGRNIRSAHSKIFLVSMEKPKIRSGEGQIYTIPPRGFIIHLQIGQNIVSNLYKNIFIHCPVKRGIPKSKIVWKLNGTSVERISGLIDLKNGTIELQGVSWEHQGTYECYHINPIGLDTASSEVKVYGENCPTNFHVIQKKVQLKDQENNTPKIAIGSNVTVIEGSNLMLQCPVSMYGRCDVSWKKDDDAVKRESWRRYGDILIEKLLVEDSGEYRCYSADRSHAYFGSVVLEVIVSVKTRLLEEEYVDPRDDAIIVDGTTTGDAMGKVPLDVGKDLTVYVGTNIKFTCRLKSNNDNFELTWLKNKRILDPDEDHVMDQNHLYFYDTREPGTVNITCMVTGLLDSAKVTSRIDVREKPKVSIKSEVGKINVTDPRKAVDGVIGKSISAISGVTVRIKCPVTAGSDKVKVSWFKDNIEIVDDPSYVFDTESKAIIIPKMNMNYAANYTCKAGRPKSDKWSAASSVVEHVEMRRPAIEFSNVTHYTSPSGPGVVMVKIGDTLVSNIYKEIIVQCKGDGLPKSEIAWKFNGKPIEEVRNVRPMKNGSLRIDSVWWDHQGVFHCYHTNPIGIDDAKMELKVVGRNTPTNYTSRRTITKIFKLHGQENVVAIGEGVIVKEESDLILRCPVGEINSIFVIWRKLKGEFERTGSTVDGSMILTTLKESDSGTYVCSSSDQANVEFGHVKVQVLGSVKRAIIKSDQKPIEYTQGLFKEVEANIGTHVRILVGNELKFLCRTKKGANVNKTWLIDGQPIPKSPDYLVNDQKVLFIKDMMRRGKFEVTCVIAGPLENTTVTSNVHIVGIQPVKINSGRGTRTATVTSKSLTASIGEEVRAVFGNTVKILCPHFSTLEAKVQWLFADKLLNNDARYVLERKTNALIIPKITQEFVGNYTCKVEGATSKAEAVSKVFMLPMQKPKLPKSSKVYFTSPLSNNVMQLQVGDSIVSNIGKRVMLNCPPTGLPLANILWKFKGKNLETTKQGYVIGTVHDTTIHKNGTLDIASITWDHRGKYECFQTNDVGLDSATTLVKVHGRYAPTNFRTFSRTHQILEKRNKVVVLPIGSKVTIAQGNSLLLQCPVHMYGKLDVKWTKDGVAYDENKDGNVFLPILSPSDTGKFICYADDPSKVIFGHVSLTVVVPPKDIIASPSKVQMNFTRVSGEEVSLDIGTHIKVLSGNTVKFRCPLLSKKEDKVEIMWFMDNRRLSEGKKYSFTANTLIVKDTSRAVTSYVSCVARGKLGTAKRTSKLEILAMRKPRIFRSKKPKMHYSDPGGPERMVLTIGDNIVTNMLKTLVIDCQATGVPKPKIAWKFNGKSLAKRSNFQKLQNNSLLITSVKWRNDGIVECYQINRAGLDTATTKITVYGRYTPTRFKTAKRNLNLMDLAEDSGSATLGSTVQIQELKTLSLECNVEGVPVYWKKADTSIMRHKDGARDMLLENIRIKDSGKYICFTRDDANVKLGAIDVKVYESLEGLIIRPSVPYMEYLEPVSRRIVVDVGTKVKIIAKNALQFRCRLKTMENIRVRWMKDGKEIFSRQAGFYFTRNTLTFTQTRSPGTSIITCVVSRPDLQTSTAKISSVVDIVGGKSVEIKRKMGTLRANDPSKTTQATIGNIINAVPGVPIEILCPTEAVPAANVSWYVDNRPIEPDSEYMIGKIQNALFIPKMAKRFAGRYKCEAVQGKVVVSASSYVYLTDMQLPKIEKSHVTRVTVPSFTKMNHIKAGASIVANLYQHVMINCVATGLPRPKVFWKFNNEPIHKKSNAAVLRNHTLFIRNMMWKNEGTYVCHATNAMGLDTAASKVTVIGRFSPTSLNLPREQISIYNITEEKTTVNIGSSITIRAGNKLLLNCPVHMYGPVSVQWEKEGKIFMGKRFPQGVVGIPRLTTEDSGKYICYSNDKAKMKFGTIDVKVIEPVDQVLSRLRQEKLKQEDTRQRQAMVGQNVTIFTGNTFKLKCPVKSDENIKVSWLRNGRPIRSSSRYLIDDNIMILLDTSRRTTYNITCVITGLLGKASITSQIFVVVFRPAEIKRSSKRYHVTSPSKSIRATIGDTIFAIPGITIEIQCPHTGLPQPQVSWYVNATEVTPMFRVPLGKIGFTLVIPKMTRRHIGRYTCQLTQKVSVKMAHTSVHMVELSRPLIQVSRRKVRTSPKITRGIRVISAGDTIVANLRKTVQITCQLIDGVPDPVRRWKFNSIPIADMDGLKVLKNGNLEVKVDWKHNGVFECYCVNMIGSDSAFTKFSVIGQRVPPDFKAADRKRRLLTLMTRPYRVAIGTNMTSRAQNSLHLQCPVSRDNDIDYFWMKNGKRMIQTPSWFGRDPLLEKVTPKDNGRYTCVSDDPAKLNFGSIDLTVLEPLQNLFVAPTQATKKSGRRRLETIRPVSEVQETDVGNDVKTISGGTIKLRCMLKSTENVLITWLKNGRKLPSNGKDVVVGNTLIIKDTDAGGNFTYTCALSGIMGTAKQSSRVEIIQFVPASILKKSGSAQFSDPNDVASIIIGQNVTSIKGVSITIKCPVTGTPKPKVAWFFNHTTLLSRASEVIVPKMMWKHVGVYTCAAKQGGKTVIAKTHLTMLGMSPPIILPSNKKVYSNPDKRWPVGINIGDSLAINLYKDLLVHCKAEQGLPKPNVVWLFNGKPIKLVQNIKQMKNGTIRISPILWTHSGLFECFRMNSMGLDTASSEVKVYGRNTPTNYEAPKKLVKVLTNRNMPLPVSIGTTLYVRSSNSLSLKCPVQTHGPVGIAWYKNKKLTRLGRQFKLQDIRADDSGEYDCRTNDHANLKFGTIKIIVLEPLEDLMVASPFKTVELMHFTSQEQDVTVGTNVTMITRNKVRFKCPLKTMVNVNVTWLVNGEADFPAEQIDSPFELNIRHYAAHGTTLRVRNTKEARSDVITCHYSSMLGSREVSSVLDVVAPSRVEMKEIQQELVLLKLDEEFEVGGSVKVRHGSSVRMRCPATGIPPPDIQWMYNDLRVSEVPGNTGLSVIKDNVLKIDLVNEKHAGIYKCIASGTDGGVNVAFVRLDVYEPMAPEIVVKHQSSELDGSSEILGRDEHFINPSSSLLIVRGRKKIYTKQIGRDYKLLSGTTLHLTCPTKGRPIPTVQWTMGGLTLATDSAKYTIEAHDGIMNNLTLANGIYTCTATNVFGSVYKSSEVTTIVPVKPVIIRPERKKKISEYSLRNVEISIGDNLETLTGTFVTIKCPAKSVPKAKITYYKDGQTLKAKKGERNLDLNTGSLMISPATPDDAGLYTCTAENEAGLAEYSTQLDLFHAWKPEILLPKSKIKYTYNANLTRGNLTVSVGQNAVAYPRTMVEFKCPVKGFPPPKIIWEKGSSIGGKGQVLAEKQGVKNSTLKYFLHDLTDAGEYFCTVSNSAGSDTKKVSITMKIPLSAHIIIKELSTILSNNMTEEITIGQHANILFNSSLTVHCPSNGEPKPKIRWSVSTKPEGWLELQPNVFISKSGDKITINQMSKIFSGIYSCKVRNIFGSDERFSNLLVKEVFPAKILAASKKKIIAPPDLHEMTAVIGEELYVRPATRLVIQCPVNGMPYPMVSWLHNDKKLISNIDADTNTLTLPHIQIKDGGTYTCVAKNVLNSARNSSKIYVGEHPEVPPVPVDIISPMMSIAPHADVNIPIGVEEVFIRAGSNAFFKCEGKGHPEPSIVWFKNNIGIDYKNFEDKYQSLIPSVLHVKKLQHTDTGVFSCMVKNDFGTIVKRTNLEVLDPPVIKTAKSNITFFTKPKVTITVGGGIIVLKGSSVTIKCPATGRPEPKIRWKEPKEKAASKAKRLTVGVGELTISDIQTKDSGKYICTASNKLASASSFMRLLVADKPTAEISYNHNGGSAVMDKERKELVVPRGTVLRLFCRIGGSPLPRVTWLKDHAIVRSSEGDEGKYEVENEYLQVKNATLDDSGTYVCMVENLLGVQTTSIKVVTGELPLISHREFVRRTNGGRLVEASVGPELNLQTLGTLRLYCNATGFPPPVMMWEIQENEGDRRLRRVSAASGVLELHNVTRGKVGDISCTATNTLGIDKTTSKIRVIDPPEIISDVMTERLSRTRFVLMGKKKTVRLLEGEGIKLICIATGSPPPKISFIHKRDKLTSEQMLDMLQASDGKPIDSKVKEMMTPKTTMIHSMSKERRMRRDEGIGFVVRTVIASAVISNVSPLDKDTYICNASNDAGSVQQKIQMYVHPEPKKPYTGTWVSTRYSNCSTPCVRADYGTKSRKVACLSYGGKVLESGWCGINHKPKNTIQCPTMLCQTKWRKGEWSECSQSCGTRGMQERTVSCVYMSGDETAQRNCDDLRMRPSERRRCNNFPCSPGHCKDKHAYCKYMNQMGFCKQEKYKTICCATCNEKKETWL